MKKEVKNVGRVVKNNIQNGVDKYIRCNDEIQLNFGILILNLVVKQFFNEYMKDNVQVDIMLF